MRDDELDRILSEGEILPSSGFTASVMDAVRREAAAPPAIPFPWKRALPGMIAAVLMLALLVLSMVFYPSLGGRAQASASSDWAAALSRVMPLLTTASEWRALGLALLVTCISLLPVRLGLRRA
jgi:hypothetical protein